MRFRRVGWYYPPGVTPRRLSAARRALQRLKDQVALFPELQPQESPEERIARADAGSLRSQAEWRQRAAEGWKRARQLLRKMPEDQRAKILAWWNESSIPAEPVHLISLIADVTKRGRDLDKDRRELDRARLLGQLMSRVMTEVPIPEGMSNKDAFFMRLSEARRRAEAEAPHLFKAEK
jgi:hypothetical protein